jgi:hypothetical protein
VTGPFFKFSFCANDFIMQKVYFSFLVKASLRWHSNVSGVYFVQVSLLLIGQQGLGDFFRCFPMAGGLCKLCQRALFRPKTNLKCHQKSKVKSIS